jgi:hypothetical protein
VVDLCFRGILPHRDNHDFFPLSPEIEKPTLASGLVWDSL